MRALVDAKARADVRDLTMRASAVQDRELSSHPDPFASASALPELNRSARKTPNAMSRTPVSRITTTKTPLAGESWEEKTARAWEEEANALRALEASRSSRSNRGM